MTEINSRNSKASVEDSERTSKRAERTQPYHQAEGLPCSGSHHSPLRQRDLDCLQQTRQTAQPLPLELPPLTPLY